MSTKVIDLTLPLTAGLRGFTSESKHFVDQDGWNSSALSIYSHAGTPVDAPIHFGVGDRTIDQISLDDYIGTAWLVSLEGIKPKTLITVEHLGAVADHVQPGDALLLRTNWSQCDGAPCQAFAIEGVALS